MPVAQGNHDGARVGGHGPVRACERAGLCIMAVAMSVHLAAGDPIRYAFWEPHMTGTSPGSDNRDWYQSRYLKTVTGDSLGFGPP